MVYPAQQSIKLPSIHGFMELLVQFNHLQYVHAGATLFTSLVFQLHWSGHRIQITIAVPDTAVIEITRNWKFRQKLVIDFWDQWKIEDVST